MDLIQEEWLSQLEADTNAVILDVRTPDEYETGIIPGAINIDIYKGQGFVYQVDQQDKTKNYYVYCHAGVRSAKACAIMKEMGFEHTNNLIGGIAQWKGKVIEP